MERINRKARILVTQPYGIGDALFMLPFLKALKEGLRAEALDLILGSRTRQILEHCPYVDGIFVIDKDKWRAQGKIRTLAEKWRLFRILQRKNYTHFVDLSMQPEYGFWAKYLLFIPERIGFNYKKRNRFLRRSLHIPDEGFIKKNMVEYFSDLAQLAGVEIKNKKAEFDLPPSYTERLKELIVSRGGRGEDYIVLSPGGGVTWGKDASRKHWPIEHFAALVGLLKARGVSFGGVVVLGIKSESELGEILEKNLDVRVVNLCGETDLMEAAAAIRMSKLFIGNDGGLVHLASSQDVPIVALYGPADPAVYGPYPEKDNVAKISKNLSCQPCYRAFRYDADCAAVSCLNDLSPEEVLLRLENLCFFQKIADAPTQARGTQNGC